ERLGLHPRIAYVTGDDLVDRVPELLAAGHDLAHLDTGRRLADAHVRPMTANAYLGAGGIVEALTAGADGVVCPRVTDAALVDGPDRVRISGTRGSPPPDTAKVALNHVGGFRNTMTFVLTGLDVEAKAAWVEQELFEVLGGRDQFATVDVQLLRFDHPDAAGNA